jgi:myosin heavy subunit
MSDTLTLLSKVLPQLTIIAVLCGFIGWSLRGRTAKPAPVKVLPAPDKGQQDRAKNLEATLEKSKAAHKALKAELEKLQSASVSQAAFDSTAAELAAARKSLDTETKRISTLEADLKKAQDAVKHLNARLNDGEKSQKDRRFALENELSKTREQLAVLQNRPDDSVELHAEIERLRESVAVSSRFAGEVRKREAAAIEALEKAESKLTDLSDPSRPVAVSKKIGPVVDSGRIAAAKAEVIRLIEMNKQKEILSANEPEVVISEPEAVVIEPEAVVIEPEVVVSEPEAVVSEPEAVVSEPEVVVSEPEAPTIPKAPLA